MMCGTDNCLSDSVGWALAERVKPLSSVAIEPAGLSNDCCKARPSEITEFPLISRIEADFGNIGTLAGLAEGCLDALTSFNWDNSECCGPMRMARGLPP